ncbi:MAG: hypothetical protein F4X39_10325 [Acidobacteriia bacterium]|nr:hypothetical protein [Terriglobia bacterium]
MPFDKSSRDAARRTYLTAIEHLRHTLSEEDVKYLYEQQVIGIDPKGRIILKAEEASSKPSKQRIQLFDLLNREIVKRDWSGGITFRVVQSSCESHSPYKELFFLPRDLVTMTLPHRRIKGNEYLRVDGLRQLSLLAPRRVGLPYGIYPRLILMFFTTERIRTKDRRFELKSSWRAFLKKLHLRWGGPTYHSIKDQVRRLCATTYTVRVVNPDSEKFTNVLVTDELFRTTDGIHITFSESFYNMTGEAVIPLESNIVLKLKRSALALDLYGWLTYRAWKITKESMIPWQMLSLQFGAAYKRQRDFRASFQRCLETVLSHKPIAPLVEFHDRGLLLGPANASDMEWVERQIARAVSTTRFPILL